MKHLTDDEYGANMAAAWLDYGNPDNHVRRAIYLSECDGKKAVAFQREYKRRKGMAPKDDSNLREFFTMIAKKDGAVFARELLAENPEGIPELGSLAHGWASVNAAEAVDWLNAIPEGAPYYRNALEGTMWGLAEASPARALAVYRSLDPADQGSGTIHNIANGTVMNHGIKGLTELVAGITGEEERRKFLTLAMEYGMRRPPAEFVQGMAGTLETAPYMAGYFQKMASRWAATNPADALSWLGESALHTGKDRALSMVASNLVQQGQEGGIKEWLKANPSAPGSTVLSTAVGGSSP